MFDDIRRWGTAETREDAYWLGASDLRAALVAAGVLGAEQALAQYRDLRDAVEDGLGCACCKDPNPTGGTFECWSCSKSYCQECINSGHECPHDNPNIAMLGGVS